VKKFIPTLLRIALSSLHVAVGSPADALDEMKGVAGVSASERAVAAVPPRRTLDLRPDTHLSVAGIASLYWAARHPTQAWRVFLPVQLDGYDASRQRYQNRDSVAERATPETLTEYHEISAHPSPTTIAPDTGGKGVRRTQTGEAT